MLVLENSEYLAVKVMDKMIAEGSGSLFGAEVPRIEHEHEHDDEDEDDWEPEAGNALVITGGTPMLPYSDVAPSHHLFARSKTLLFTSS